MERNVLADPLYEALRGWSNNIIKTKDSEGCCRMQFLNWKKTIKG